MLAGVAAHADTYSFVGQWALGEAPHWNDNLPVYSGQSAAALLFGGNASDYVISTVGVDPNLVNHMAWVDGWGVHPPQQAGEGFSVSSDNSGFYRCCGPNGPSFSANGLRGSGGVQLGWPWVLPTRMLCSAMAMGSILEATVRGNGCAFAEVAMHSLETDSDLWPIRRLL